MLNLHPVPRAPGAGWRRFAALLAIGVSIAWLGVAFTAVAEGLPPALQAAGEHGENVYDAVKATQWSKATAGTCALLKDSAAIFRSGLGDGRSLAKKVGKLMRAVQLHDRIAALRAANRVTGWVTQQSAAYHPTVPTAVAMLDYHGREVQIAAESGDANELQRGLAGLRQCWDEARALRPETPRPPAAAMDKFGDLVSRLESAQSPAEHVALSEALLEAVDDLEKGFEG
jgi:hypothetical protein